MNQHYNLCTGYNERRPEPDYWLLSLHHVVEEQCGQVHACEPQHTVAASSIRNALQLVQIQVGVELLKLYQPLICLGQLFLGLGLKQDHNMLNLTNLVQFSLFFVRGQSGLIDSQQPAQALLRSI